MNKKLLLWMHPWLLSGSAHLVFIAVISIIAFNKPVINTSAKLYSAKVDIKNSINGLLATPSTFQPIFNNTRIESMKKDEDREQTIQESFVMPEVTAEVQVKKPVPDSFSATTSRRISPEEYKRWSKLSPNGEMVGNAFIPAQPTGEGIQNKLPVYPEQAREHGHEGLVVLTVEILRDGTVSKIEIISSSGYPLLDESAVKTVRDWKFKPATVRGHAIKSTIKIPIRFRLE